jgi:hypothetical protein
MKLAVIVVKVSKFRDISKCELDTEAAVSLQNLKPVHFSTFDLIC